MLTTHEERRDMRRLLRTMAAHLKTTNKGLELQSEAYAKAAQLYTQEEKTHCLMMATREGRECADFADLLKQQGSVIVEFWLDAREA